MNKQQTSLPNIKQPEPEQFLSKVQKKLQKFKMSLDEIFLFLQVSKKLNEHKISLNNTNKQSELNLSKTNAGKHLLRFTVIIINRVLYSSFLVQLSNTAFTITTYMNKLSANQTKFTSTLFQNNKKHFLNSLNEFKTISIKQITIFICLPLLLNEK